LKRAPWNIDVIDENIIVNAGETNDTHDGLMRRVDLRPITPEPGQGDMVLSLWKNCQSKVPVNNKFVKFDITPDKTVVMTTDTCYGCTAVVMVSLLCPTSPSFSLMHSLTEISVLGSR
jgi:hypothetical protein